MVAEGFEPPKTMSGDLQSPLVDHLSTQPNRTEKDSNPRMISRTIGGLVNRSIRPLCHLSKKRVTGFEPVRKVWKTHMLPLHHTRNEIALFAECANPLPPLMVDGHHQSLATALARFSALAINTFVDFTLNFIDAKVELTLNVINATIHTVVLLERTLTVEL